ncbi:hypothetical protein BVRB_5g124730 [Beta vulgaris subsp. vulgaris]|uniref:RecQ-mediated genome instability protein 1 n=1 Tax=Beta vulgaris subsp. vulgaris TaxID=3555 RepID=A0A0J8B8S2_BETVV|nr:recQ-mediated genome instability protein 1 isoform X2 [Beta vulgaris subsp. vulgaris]KMS97689.1 hypothetical protein BVRB_5g124730 [Beta vulgaris subsp. vulgaris]
MSRRRLRTIYTSSSEDEEVPQQPQQQEQQQQEDEQHVVFDEPMYEEIEEEIDIPSPNQIPNISSVTLNSSHSTTVAEPPSVELSDEDFIDVSEHLSPPSPIPARVLSDCPVNDHLRKLGLNLKREWLDSCKLGLHNTVPGFNNFDVEAKAKLCFAQFLCSDFNYSGAGVLPPNVHQLHLVDLAGPFVLQVDEVINISCPLRERYKNAAPGLKRCLKLSMTDGVQHVFGMEYRPIKCLEALAPAGFKVVIRNVNIRRGLLMLVPEVLEILGGSVEELEAARQRLVHEVNKPPRGKRTRSGIVPPLSTRATLAAWAQNGVNNDSTSVNDANHVPGNTRNSMLHAATQFREYTLGGDPISRIRQAPHAGRVITELSSSGRTDQHSLSSVSAQNNTSRGSAQLYSSLEARVLPVGTDATEPLHGKESAEHSTRRETAQTSVGVDAHEFPTSNRAPEQAPAGEHTELNLPSATVTENEDAHMVDYMEHPFILSGERELPFIYLASLSAIWDAVQFNKPFIKGKIKCFLTGVKRFQYKGRSMFELRVYVDDGSLISEILIHHNVVHKVIGYSPEGVTAALSSSDDKVVEDMKSVLKQFQIFLINFEGSMLLEMNKTSTIPVALEMNQGCPTSDAWLLLQRLTPVTSNPVHRNSQSDVITLSP